jgi:hypothetical protein
MMIDLKYIPEDIITEAIKAELNPDDLVEFLDLTTDSLLYYCFDEILALIEEEDDELAALVEEYMEFTGIDWEVEE